MAERRSGRAFNSLSVSQTSEPASSGLDRTSTLRILQRQVAGALSAARCCMWFLVWVIILRIEYELLLMLMDEHAPPPTLEL